MTAPALFQYNDHAVRTVTVDGEPLFVVADVAAVLGYRAASDVMRFVDEEDRGTEILRTPGGDQRFLVTNESGLWSILTSSRRPEAKPVRRWITAEVMPTIRRTGSYSIVQPATEAAPASRPTSQLEVLRAVVDELIATREIAERAEIAAQDAVDDAKVANARLDAIEAYRDNFTASAWAKVTGFRPNDRYTLGRLGRIAGTIGRTVHGLKPGKVPDERDGTVNSWPVYVWEEAAARFQVPL